MRASKSELPVLVEAGAASVRGADWGGMRAAVVSVPAGTDFGPLLKGLPDDRCPCPHWGYVMTGRLRIAYADREEILHAGDVYYMPSGHTGVAEEDTEFLEIAPRSSISSSSRTRVGTSRRLSRPRYGLVVPRGAEITRPGAATGTRAAPGRLLTLRCRICRGEYVWDYFAAQPPLRTRRRTY